MNKVVRYQHNRRLDYIISFYNIRQAQQGQDGIKLCFVYFFRKCAESDNFDPATESIIVKTGKCYTDNYTGRCNG